MGILKKFLLSLTEKSNTEQKLVELAAEVEALKADVAELKGKQPCE